MSIPQVPLPPILIPVAVLIYGFFHSITATPGFKQRLSHRIGPKFDRYYRLIYSLLAVITLLPVISFALIIPDIRLYIIQVPYLFVTALIQVAALALLAFSLLQTGALQFIGIPQALGREAAETLNTSGLYHYVRHPLYSFSLVFLWLFPVMTRNLLLMFAAITVYMVVGAIVEERKLLKEFGTAYAEYQTRTPFMIPFKKR